MIDKTRGIVINYIRLRETSIVVNIYTEAFGIRSYIENGIRTVKSKNKIALFQPLTLLDLVVFENENKGLKRIKEIKCIQPYQSLPYDISKSSIALFISEILKKSLKEEEANPPLFQFLYESFLIMDHPSTEISNFHLIFMVKLSAFLGFTPESSEQVLHEFQLLNIRPFSKEISMAFNQILNADYNTNVKIVRQTRFDVLEILLSFYKIHIEGFGDLRSHSILKEVLG